MVVTLPQASCSSEHGSLVEAHRIGVHKGRCQGQAIMARHGERGNGRNHRSRYCAAEWMVQQVHQS